MFKPIVLIPTYNHHKELSSIVKTISHIGIDVLIIDDGSDECTKRTLLQIKESTPAAVLSLEKNQGKGIAVKVGIRYARDKGYSHCIQIDADGQHDLNDLPRIIELAQSYPERVILGNPLFDESKTPKCRIWGRKISNFWIALETMSLQVKDGLCGYRCYPVSETIKVIDNEKTGNRMDFDPEILVRLRWQGVKVYCFDTRVNYVDKEPSNFNLIQDNIRICRIFMKLFWVGIGRLIWKRKTVAKTAENWTEIRERGNKFFIYFTFVLYSILKKRLTQIILQPVIIYFYITDKKGRNASRIYLEKIYKKTSSKLLFRPYFVYPFIHYNSFASSLLDKIGVRIPGKSSNFKISYFGYDEVEGLIKKNKGALFIGAHFGNFDVIRLIAKQSELKLKILMYRRHAQMINSLFSRIKDKKDDSIIEIDSINVGTAAMLSDYVNGGGFLGILGDRVSPGSQNKVVKSSFLGEDAVFPQGPWIIAGLLKCPVIFFYAACTGTEKYEIHFDKLFETVNMSSGNRDDDIKKYIAEYIIKLENACQTFPYQWYNFYNFWQERRLEN